MLCIMQFMGVGIYKPKLLPNSLVPPLLSSLLMSMLTICQTDTRMNASIYSANLSGGVLCPMFSSAELLIRPILHNTTSFHRLWLHAIIPSQVQISTLPDPP